MKQIFLLRHAKSDWNNLGEQDFDRSLAKRGIQDASTISNYVKKNNHLIEKVLCSSSKRTKQTFDYCSDGFNFPIENAEYLDDLYFGDTDKIIRLIQNINESISSILIVGHNPTLHLLIENLTDESILKFSTCNLAIISFKDKWKNLSSHKCKLKSLLRPKEI